MKLDIKKLANKGRSQEYSVVLEDRLPSFVDKPVELKYSFNVESRGDYYLLQLEESGEVHLVCQRCADTWIFPYHQIHELAICADEAVAEKYHLLYDVVVFTDLIIDICDVLADNLHLFLPKKHEKVDQCNKNQLKLIQND